MSGGRRFGKYLLHDRLAVGGMGELHLATEVGAARGTPPCVLKILLPEYSGDAEFVSMFHDEARIGLQLRHPNIVGVYDLGRVADSPYLGLEYVHGENLRTILNRAQDKGEKFPVEHAVYITIEALHGLAYAHQVKDGRGRPLNLVHRDLSPDNIMVTFDGDVKVLDFGIAKAEGRATKTQFGILKGKVQYMSPEQALGWTVDARTDVYAMGLVLVEALTGERRFENVVDPVQMIRDARAWTPKAPSDQDKTIPVELDAILLKSLQSATDRRFQSADEMVAALIRLRRGGSLPRPKESLPELMRRLFPDRAEPFLQVDPSYRKDGPVSEATRASDDLAPLPDEQELLGAFLSRGPSTDPKLSVDSGTHEATVIGARPEITAPGSREPLSDPTIEGRGAHAPVSDPSISVSVSDTRVGTVRPARPALEQTAPVFEKTSIGGPPSEGTVVEARRERSREFPAVKKSEKSRDGIPAARKQGSRDDLPAARRAESSRDDIPAARRAESSRDGIPAAKRRAVPAAPPADETTAAGGPPQERSVVEPLPLEKKGAGRVVFLALLLLAGAAGFAVVAFEDRLPPELRARIASLSGRAPVAPTPEPVASVEATATPEATTPEAETTPDAEATEEGGTAAGGGRFPGEKPSPKPAPKRR